MDSLVTWALSFNPLVYAVVILTALWYWLSKSRGIENLPPMGVRPYPLVGHAPFLVGNPIKAMCEWKRLKGDIISFYLGPKLVVVISSLPLLKESLIKKGDIFSDRPIVHLVKAKLKAGGKLGIIFNSGPNWKEQRTLSMSILRDFGMGKNWLAEKISEEVHIYLDALSEFGGAPHDARTLTSAAVTNIICTILIGHRFELDDPKFISLVNLVNENMALLKSANLIDVFPWLQYLPGDLFKAKKVEQNIFNLINYFKVMIEEEVRAMHDGKNGNSFIQSYLLAMKQKQEAQHDTYLTEASLNTTLSSLFGAGGETTATTITWAILLALRYPEVQEKCYKEIIEVIGDGRQPIIADRPKMTYVNAFIMEVQRLNTVAPLGAPHQCNQTTEVAGYTIPKDTMIFVNIHEVLNDPFTWGDPETFRPERFLDKDGKLEVPEEFIPFSIGRRFCMGESMAKTELFLFITSIFQRFEIKPDDSHDLPPLDPVYGLTAAPKLYKARFVDRRNAST